MKKDAKINYSLGDVIRATFNKLSDPNAEFVRSGAVGVADIVDPALGAAAGVGNAILSSYNDFKLNYLLKGLSCGLNVEKRQNQLYTYVTSSVEKAVIVANTFRRTINAETPKVCILYGMILADHLDDDTTFTNDELIVCRALEGATDFDLENFKVVMEKFLKPSLSESENVGDCQVSFPKDFDRETEYNTTCDWCVYNRLFTSHEPVWQGVEDTVFLDENYYATNAAVVLMEYIHKARPIWDYQ